MVLFEGPVTLGWKRGLREVMSSSLPITCSREQMTAPFALVGRTGREVSKGERDSVHRTWWV